MKDVRLSVTEDASERESDYETKVVMKESWQFE
jgi:hypothetical protein